MGRVMTRVNFRMDVNTSPREYTVKEVSALLGVSGDRIRKRLRSLMKTYNIPPARVIRLENGRWKYVIDEELFELLKREFTPKIRIEVKVQ